GGGGAGGGAPTGGSGQEKGRGVGHPWPPPHCDDPGTGRVVWDAMQRGGSRVRAALRQWHPAALRWRRRPAAVVPPTTSTASPPAGRDGRHHGPPLVHPPADGRGRAHRPDAAASPHPSPQPTPTAGADPLVLDVWWSVRLGPSLSLIVFKRFSLW